MDSPKRPDADIVIVGRLTGVHGVRGGMKLLSFTQPREAIFSYRPWFIGRQEREMECVRGRPKGKTLVAEIRGIETREVAQEFVGQEISVSRDRLPELESGEYYWTDLIGLNVFTLDGQDLGAVERLIETGANDVLVVQGDRERLIPYVPGHFVKRVDLDQRRLEVDWDPEF